MLFEGTFAIELEDIFRNISFIFFNYDRCIEFYLWIALQDYFNITSQEAAKLVQTKLKIIHPYGSLGPI